eukprot:1040002-Pyramimonas_sp.AAC.1
MAAWGVGGRAGRRGVRTKRGARGFTRAGAGELRVRGGGGEEAGWGESEKQEEIIGGCGGGER